MVVIGKEKAKEYLKEIIDKHEKGILIKEIYDAAIDRTASYIASIKFILDYPKQNLPQELVTKTSNIINDLEKILHNLKLISKKEK